MDRNPPGTVAGVLLRAILALHFVEAIVELVWEQSFGASLSIQASERRRP